MGFAWKHAAPGLEALRRRLKKNCIKIVLKQLKSLIHVTLCASVLGPLTRPVLSTGRQRLEMRGDFISSGQRRLGAKSRRRDGRGAVGETKRVMPVQFCGKAGMQAGRGETVARAGGVDDLWRETERGDMSLGALNLRAVRAERRHERGDKPSKRALQRRLHEGGPIHRP
jgi:hypothetical protein